MSSSHLVPPLRYTQLTPTIHRGSYPRKVNFPFLQRLQLRTIVSLTPTPLTADSDPELYAWVQSQGITVLHFPLGKEHKKKFVHPSNDRTLEILMALITSSDAPVYLHCLNGGAVTSLVVASLRKVQLWNTVAIFREFTTFSDAMSLKDRAYIEQFRVSWVDLDQRGQNRWLWQGISWDVVVRHPTLNPSV